MRLQPQSAIAKRYAVQAISEHRPLLSNDQPLLLNDGLQERQALDQPEIVLQDQVTVLIPYAVAPTLVIASLPELPLAVVALAPASLLGLALAVALVARQEDDKLK